MNHLKFSDELQKFGVRISSTHFEGRIREYTIPETFEDKIIVSDGFNLKWKDKNLNRDIPINSLLKKAINIGQWKYSQHIEIKPENYEDIEEIIQTLILNRVKTLDELTDIYFQLHNEMAEIKKNNLK